MNILQSSLSALLGALAAFVFTHLKEASKRRRRALGELYGIEAEIELSQKYARAYLQSISDGRKIWSPAYRAPTEFARSGLPSLNTEYFINKQQMLVCLEWYAATMEFNRCLDAIANFVSNDRIEHDDNLHGVPMEGTPRKKSYGEIETERIAIKCQNLLELVVSSKSAVRQAIQAHSLEIDRVE